MVEFQGQVFNNERELTHALHLFLLIDTSASMAHNVKIQALNNAICESVPKMKYFQTKYLNTDIYIRAITFSTGARWHITQPTPLEEFQWQDVTAGGLADMGKAFKLMTQKLKQTDMRKILLPPVLILISYGQPTDNWRTELKKMIDTPMGNKSLRIAVGIGQEVSPVVLRQFVNNSSELIFKTNNTNKLVSLLEEALISGLIYVYLEENLERSLKSYDPVYDGLCYKSNRLLKEIN